MRGFIRNLIGCLYTTVWQLTGCGHWDPREGASIEAPFIPYVETFEKECGCKVRDLPITFAEMESEDHIGECQNYRVFTESYSEIFIDHSFWDTASNSVRERLIFHELGHCVLRRLHSEAKGDDGFPISLMYPSIERIPIAFYLEIRQKLLDELFQRGEFAPKQKQISKSKIKSG